MPVTTFTPITPGTIQSVVDQINQSFGLLFDLPTFRGLPGQAGAPGLGIQGERGRSFATVRLDILNAAIGGVWTTASFNLTALQAQFLANPSALVLAMTTESLIPGDHVLLGNGQLVWYDGTSWLDTGINLIPEDVITAQTIIDILTSGGTSGTVRLFTTTASLPAGSYNVSVTHGFGTLNVQAVVYDAGTNRLIKTDVETTSISQVALIGVNNTGTSLPVRVVVIG